jgi:hypothetical protein
MPIARCAAVALVSLLPLSCAAQGPPMGAMLPGNLYTLDGRVLDFAIQKEPRSGDVTAFDPTTQERFSGTYVGVLESTSASSSGLVTNGRGFAVGSGSAVSGSNMADATAFLRGDKGSMLTCSMRIEAAVYPHGLGTCTDNRGGSYRLQF